ncbi:type II toxin-antitoxin system toxin DNA ADP-ribosyl transferase DarT [Coleofasciculus sp. E1-EBD-02]|uniref:type II toxin-antitoxin system toxin DNA ADP-ribosyl transferase DarT n=1 Tax=Coleofasciculus sp. E1-EBD-02 TaxID=3068481 RepID=UPI0032F25DC4
MPIPIYHITDIKNLTSILERAGLFAYNRLRQDSINYINIAYQTIQDRRATTTVPCGAGGVLHDYVPFYFAPRSPMLYTIHRGNVPGYTQGQRGVLYLVSSVEAIATNLSGFVFTDGHGIMAYSDFYDDLAYLNRIDWQIMKENYWADTPDDGDRKRRRQAEFLVHRFCPWKLIEEIGVFNSTIQVQVRQLLQKFNYQPPVNVYRDWYY